MKNKTIIFQRVRGEQTWRVYRVYKNEYDARKAFQVINRNNPDIEYRRGIK